MWTVGFPDLRREGCSVVCCGVVWCAEGAVPEGKGRDVYSRVQVNGRAVCVACALCVSVLFAAESGKKGDLEAPHTAIAVRPLLLAQELLRDSLPFRLLVQA